MIRLKLLLAMVIFIPPHMLTEDAVMKWIFGFTLKERMTQFRDVFDVNLLV